MHGNSLQDRDLSSRARRRAWLVNYPRAVPIGIFLAIIAITALSVFAIEQGEQQRERATIGETAQSVASALDRQGNNSSTYLRAGAAFFNVVDGVNAPLFRRFVSALRMPANYGGADGIGWAPALEAPLGTSAGDGAVTRRVPVTFLQPDSERNRRALGYDMYAEPVRRAAMDEAERRVQPVASGRVVLRQEGGSDAPGFLIYMPIFGGAAGERELKGFIYSPFNAQTFLNAAIGETRPRGLNIRLYDGVSRASSILASHKVAEPTGEVVSEQVVIANRPFLLEVQSVRSEKLSALSMATLLFGLAVASLLMLVARLLTQQAIEDEASLNAFAQQASIRDSLTRELNHRVKNTLANVLSIISLTRRRAHDLDSFAVGLEGRVRALSATHDLLTDSEWGTTPLRSVVEAELAPYVQLESQSLELHGPEVELAPNDALSLGLALHELVTNASKYGALSDTNGKVSIEWHLQGDQLAVVEWREAGGPKVSPNRKSGFGTELIEKIVAHELRHPVELTFDEGGVCCVLRVPVRERTDFQMRAAEPNA